MWVREREERAGEERAHERERPQRRGIVFCSGAALLPIIWGCGMATWWEVGGGGRFVPQLLVRDRRCHAQLERAACGCADAKRNR